MPTRRTSRRPTSARARRRARSSTRASSRTSTSTCSSTTRTRDELNWINEGLVRLGADAHRLRRPVAADHGSGLRLAHPVLPRLARRPTPVEPEPACSERAGELADALGGPGLTREILCDYGAAYTMMEFLHGRYGTSFMTPPAPRGRERSRRSPGGARSGRIRHDSGRTSSTTGRPMVAVDGLLDDGAKTSRVASQGAVLRRRPWTRRSTGTTPHAYATPGAPPNGSDYVRLRDAERPLGVKDIDSLPFNGAATHAPRPHDWRSIRTRLGRPVTRRCTRARATTATKRSCAPFLFRRAQARA